MGQAQFRYDAKSSTIKRRFKYDKEHPRDHRPIYRGMIRSLGVPESTPVRQCWICTCGSNLTWVPCPTCSVSVQSESPCTECDGDGGVLECPRNRRYWTLAFDAMYAPPGGVPLSESWEVHPDPDPDPDRLTPASI